MNKRIFAVMLALLMCFAVPAQKVAASDAPSISPRFIAINTAIIGSSMSTAGYFSFDASVDCYPNSGVTKVKIDVEIQKQVNGKWTYYDDFTYSRNSYFGGFDDGLYVSIGAYRAVAKCYVYSGSTLLDSTTLTSNTRSYYGQTR